VTGVIDPGVAAPGGQPGPDEPAGGPARSHVARNTALVVGAALVLFIAVLATRKPPGETQNPLIGHRVPALAGPTLAGGRVDVDSFRGRWVVVNFLASWCVGCVEEHPDLLAFAERHRDDVQVVGVAYNDDADKLREFFRLKGGDWPVILSPRNSAAYDFGVTGVPESFVVRPDGLIVNWSPGVTAEWLEQVLAVNTAPGPSAPSPPGTTR
jgi:cytochrome c biogenesis protein CcmG, thiol:disulfide interchange protein DsbE